MQTNKVHQQRLQAYQAKKQAKFDKTIGKKPTNIKFKDGTIKNIRDKYYLSQKAVNEYNNIVKTNTAIGFRMALIKVILSAGNMRKDSVIKMFFYAKDVEAYAHWIETELAKVEVSDDSVLGKEIVANIRTASFNKVANQAKKIVEAHEYNQKESQADEISDELKNMLEELEELTNKIKK